jgi:hypothetical protein
MSNLPPRKLDPFAALLSYLVPGLGQIYQGRTAKGVLFLVSLYVLFFYGMWLGSFRNVYLPHSDTRQNVVFKDMKTLGDVENRLQFLGQVPIGIVAWPAIMQYATFDTKANQPTLTWTWQQAPKEEELNALQRNGDKRWDLGWVYTVIAGVLNILVIYDALAGPAVREAAGAAGAAAREAVPA